MCGVNGRRFSALFKWNRIKWSKPMSLWSLTDRQSVFKRYDSKKHSWEFYPQNGSGITSLSPYVQGTCLRDMSPLDWTVLQFWTGVFLTPSQVYDTEQRPLLRCIRIMDPIMDLVNNQIMGWPREHLASGTVAIVARSTAPAYSLVRYKSVLFGWIHTIHIYIITVIVPSHK